MPADYFGSDPRQRVLDNYEELSRRCVTWQNQVLVWDAMEYPPKPPKEQKTSSDNMQNATYVSIFIRATQVTYVNRMDRAEPYVEVALEEVGSAPDESQKRKSAAVERACYGILNAVRLKAVRQVQGTSMSRRMYSSSGNPGKIIQFVHMRSNEDGTADPVWEIIDPYNCYHDFDTTPFRFVREYYQPASKVKAEFEDMGIEEGVGEEGRLALENRIVDLKNSDVHVVNHWLLLKGEAGDEVWNTFLVDNKLLFHRKTKFKRMPFQIFVTNSSPRTYQNISQGIAGTGTAVSKGSIAGYAPSVPDTFILRHAQPLWAPLEPTMEQFAEGMSLLMKAIALMVNRPFLHLSQQGNEVIGNSKLRTPGQEVTLAKDLGEEVELLDVVRQVPDALGVLNYLVRDMDRIVPAAAFGQTAVSGESGYLYDKRSRDAALVAFADPARACSVALEMGLMELLEQFRDAKLKIKLSATSASGDSAGKLWYRNFSSADIPESFVIKVRVAPELPDDDAKAAQIASMLLQAGVMSPETAMSKIVGIKDPQAELERIRRGKAANLPMMDLLMAVENLKREADDNRARASEAERDGKSEYARLYRFNAARLDEWRIAFERQMGGGRALPNAQQGALLNGPSPDVLPPEQYDNPDDKAGAMNEVSSSREGRPASKNGSKGE